MSIRCSLRALRATLTHFQHRCPPALVALALAGPALGQPSIEGQWDPPTGGYDWPLAAIHAVHLSTGDILVWDTHNTNPLNDPKLWNPADGTFTDVPTDSQLFCAGHAGLADGSVLVAGGGVAQAGTTETTIYNLTSFGPWELVEPMNYARWYPTCTTLPNGKILAISGKDENQVNVEWPEIYDPADDTWLAMTNPFAEKKLRTYPYMFVVPDPDDPNANKVFFAGPGVGPGMEPLETWTLDVNAQSWDLVGLSPFNGVHGSAVMYEPGKVLKAGGTTDGPREDEAATIDLTVPTPVWFSEESMLAAREHHTLVLLANGTVLAVGGQVSGAPPFIPELYDPETEMWYWMAEMTKKRGHHSIALLLADATVLAAGGDGGNPDSDTAEIFSPPYLFWGPRPVIGFAPTVVQYGQVFRVMMTLAGTQPIGKVSLVRLAAVTHRFDQNQRFMSLDFVVTNPQRLDVQAPANETYAPPGYYMLFLISEAGVPSVAKYVRVE